MPIPIAKSKPVSLAVTRKFPNAKCEECPLYRGRVTVPDIIAPTVAKKPRIMALGEGPAAEEAAKGLPFQGDSGKIIREALRDRGLDKFGVVLDNAVACDTRILQKSWSDNDASVAVKRAKFKQAINACKDRLWDSIEEHDPELIIILGNIAKEAIVPEVREGIMKLAGTYHEVDGWEMIFNYHPAFLLHAREGERFIADFLTNLNEARLFFEAEPINSEVIVADTVAKAKKALKELTGQKLIAADVETTSFSPYEDGWTINPPATPEQKAVALVENYTLQERKMVYFGKLLSVQLCGDGKRAFVFPAKIATSKTIKPLMSKFLQSHKLLAHNAAFDIPWLVRYFGNSDPDSMEAEHDTMLMSLSMNENPGHSLKKLGREELGFEDWSEATDFWRPKRSTSFANIPPEVLFPYGGYDVVSTIELVKPLRKRQNNDDARLYDNWLMPINRMFTKMSIRGTSIDIGLLAKTSGYLDKEAARLKKFLQSEYGLKNPNASQQVQNILLDPPEDGGFHMDFPDNVTTGKATLEGLRVDDEAKGDVEEWEWDLSEFSKGVLDYRTAYKARNTYMKDVARSIGWKDLERNGKQLIGKVHPDFKLFSQVTGRVSINNPTLINYSKGTRFSEHIRNYFIPRPGYAWFHADYKNFELRVFASMMNDDILRKIFLTKNEDGSSLDPHREVGMAIYGEDFDALNKRAFGMLRVITKQCVFGRLYNRGHEAIAEQLEIEESESLRICTVIDNFFGKLEEYREMVFDMVFSTQKLVNPIGRTRRFPLITRSNQKRIENMAVNYLIQSTASDLNLIAVHEVTQQFPDVFPLFTIHDSCEFEIPLDKVDEYKPKIIEILEQFPRTYFPDSDIPMEVDADVFNFWQADDKKVLETPVLYTL